MNGSKRIILAGGSGFLGTALTDALLPRGYEMVILTRRASKNAGTVRQIEWDGLTPGPWTESIDGARAVVNLAGRSVNCRYTAENRREIVDSRVDSVRVLGEAIRACANPPPVWVQSGSLAIYGDSGNRWCDESSPPGGGFPVETCIAWEREFDRMETPQTRKVLLRIGFALGAGGGVLAMLAGLARCFLGGAAGNGLQYISWLHIEDLIRMFEWAIERPEIEGVFNATGPNPVTNAEFMRELRCALHRPWSPPVPAWAVQLGCRLMGTEACLALTGRRGTPKRFADAGFQFAYPELKPALAGIFNKPPGEIP